MWTTKENNHDVRGNRDKKAKSVSGEAGEEKKA